MLQNGAAMLKTILKPRLSLAFFLLLSAGSAVSLQAETAGLPKDKPVFTVELPAGWKADYNTAPNGVFMGDADLKNTIMVMPMAQGTEISDAAGAKAALIKFLEQDMKEALKDITFNDPAGLTVAGQKAYSIKSTQKSGGPAGEFVIFTPDGTAYFAAITSGDVAAVIASIKASE
jgi:hypothetical protein